VSLPDATWLYEPFPAPDFSAPDLQGQLRSFAALRGRPAAVLLWSTEGDASRSALAALAGGYDRLVQAGVGALAIALGPPASSAQVAARTAGAVPVIASTRELGLSIAIVHRFLFMNRPALPLPTLWLLDAAGRVVKVYRDHVDVPQVLQDAARIDVPATERLARALPFAGTLYSPPPLRNYLPYGRELLDEQLEGPALAAFERAAEASPTAYTLYRLGTLLARRGDAARARTAFERALGLQPDLAEASNDLGALLAQGGDLPAAIERFRAAVAAAPDYPDALNNLGYALLLSGSDQDARVLYEKAVALQPDFPEALNNLGLLRGRAGELEAAEGYFRDALRRRADYGEAANNLALVLVARGQSDAAVAVLERFLAAAPAFEGAYVTLAKIHLAAGRTREGLSVLERLLQLNSTHPVALELARQWQPK